MEDTAMVGLITGSIVFLLLIALWLELRSLDKDIDKEVE